MPVEAMSLSSWGQLIMNLTVHRYCMKKFDFSYEGVEKTPSERWGMNRTPCDWNIYPRKTVVESAFLGIDK
jgi:hypothetical protein